MDAFIVETIYRVRLDWTFDAPATDATDAELKLVAYVGQLRGMFAGKEIPPQDHVRFRNDGDGPAWNAYLILEGQNKKQVTKAAQAFLTRARRFKGFSLLD